MHEMNQELENYDYKQITPEPAKSAAVHTGEIPDPSTSFRL